MNDRTMLLPLVDAPFPELKQSLRTNLIGYFTLGGHSVAVIANGPDAVWLEIAISSREQWMPLGTVTKINDDQPRVSLKPVLDRSGRRVLVPCATTDADLLDRVRAVRAGDGR